MSLRRTLRRALAALAVLAAVAGAPGALAQRPVPDAIRARVAVLRAGGTIVVAGTPVRASAGLIQAYERSGHAPLWTDPPARLALARALDDKRDGLPIRCVTAD